MSSQDCWSVKHWEAPWRCTESCGHEGADGAHLVTGWWHPKSNPEIQIGFLEIEMGERIPRPNHGPIHNHCVCFPECAQQVGCSSNGWMEEARAEVGLRMVRTFR